MNKLVALLMGVGVSCSAAPLGPEPSDLMIDVVAEASLSNAASSPRVGGVVPHGTVYVSFNVETDRDRAGSEYYVTFRMCPTSVENSYELQGDAFAVLDYRAEVLFLDNEPNGVISERITGAENIEGRLVSQDLPECAEL